MRMHAKVAGWMWVLGLALVIGAPAAASEGKTLRAFDDEAQFQKLLAGFKQKAEAAQRQRERAWANSPPMSAPMPPAPAAPAAVADSSSALDAVQILGGNDGSDAITNVQVAGVDEGDIVKKRGDFLIVLRRGRLFTVRVGDDALRPVSQVDAYGPGVDPGGTWYDEMLVSDRTVAVIGYSYARGGTEVGVFDLAADGTLHYRDTYQLRSNDYYSARNYASRLIGHQLVFYTPLSVNVRAPASRYLPALRHWRPDATPEDFQRILPATRIYRSPTPLHWDDDLALHSVVVCDLDAPHLDCQATAVLGPEGRVFFVAEDAVYVWTAPWEAEQPNQSTVFRLPLDGGAPSALRASGSPIDQMSFLQRDGYLNVLVGSEAGGDAMWASRRAPGALALLRVPLTDFGDGSDAAARARYRALPGSDEDGELHNRFIGDWLVYGAEDDPIGAAYALRYADSTPTQVLFPGLSLERIEAMAGDGLLVGASHDDLRFTSLRLGTQAALAGSYVQAGARQGEARSHGFFYRPTGEEAGIAGLPIVGAGRGDAAQAAVLYLRNQALQLRPMGALEAQRGSGRVDDGCQASCVDWYGNARPIFVGERVFALLGYELVEGRVEGGRIVERRRIDFAPPPPPARAR